MKILHLFETYTKTPVESSHIVDIEHNGKNLYVSFNNGTRYEYFDVPTEVARRLRLAPSKGKEMWASIRSQYDYRRMRSGEGVRDNLKKGIPVNYEVVAPNGDTYVWRGQQFVNTSNNRIARKEISQGLRDYALAKLDKNQT